MSSDDYNPVETREALGRPTMLNVAVSLVVKLKRRSVCKRMQQACIITDDDVSAIYAMGYNGRAAGESHEGCVEGIPGGCGCVHAEMNALVKLRTERGGLTLICTQSPCELCARLIINSKMIKKVLFLETYRSTIPLLILTEAKIAWERI